MTSIRRLGEVVDRLAISPHLHMRTRREEIRERLDALKLESPVYLIDLRPLLLIGSAPRWLLDEFARFQPPGSAAKALDAWLTSGAAHVDGDDIVASDAVVDFLSWSTDAYDQFLEGLWSDRMDDLTRLSPVLDHVIHTPQQDDLRLFNTLRDLPPSRDTPWFRVWHQIVTLRYLRSDRHVSALRRRGISLAAAALFDAPAGGREHAEWLGRVASDELRTGRWIADDGRPTEQGESGRAAIDSEVDALMVDTFDAVPGSVDLLTNVLPGLPHTM